MRCFTWVLDILGILDFLSRILGQIDNRLIHRTVRNHEEMDFGLGPDLDLINTSVFICIR
jgi:hypothetical protein